jgi:hypothetical protein
MPSAATPLQTTELTAVNLMLSSLGERPVSNLANAQRLDVQRAIATLNEVNVLVQTRGWWFNAETKVVLTPNADGEYIVAADVTKIDAYLTYITQYVQRGRRLFNTDTQLFTGNEGDLLVNQTRLLPFDDCPETFKMYVARRAGTIYQQRSLGSPTLFEFTNRAADEAFAVLQQEETDQEDINLTFAPGIFDAVYRR